MKPIEMLERNAWRAKQDDK